MCSYEFSEEISQKRRKKQLHTSGRGSEAVVKGREAESRSRSKKQGRMKEAEGKGKGKERQKRKETKKI